MVDMRFCWYFTIRDFWRVQRENKALTIFERINTNLIIGRLLRNTDFKI